MWENPRVRGAYSWESLSPASMIGEPPRARGLRSERLVGLASHRRTPACAGPTQHHMRHPRQLQENPRVRGAYPTCATQPRWPPGEPPRARGLHLLAREYSASFS